MSYLQVPIKIIVDGIMKYRIVGPSEIPPDPVDGYEIDPEPVEIDDVEGKFWVEYTIIRP